MNDARMYKGLMLTLVMLLSAISPILSPVSADHENGTGTGMNNYGPQIDLSIWDNNSSSWDVISPYEEVFLDIGTYQMEILSSNLSLNDSYMIEWDIFSYGVEEMMGEEEPDSIYESRNWTGYYNSSSESFNITIEEFNCGNWIEINLYNQSGMNQLAFGEYQIMGPCGSNGILSTHIEIDNNEYEVEHMFITGFDGSIELETGNYNMSWSVPNQTFNYNQDYLIQFSRGVGSMDSYNETEGNYSWTDGSQQGVGLGSQTWTIEVTDETCEINNDGLLWQAAYFSNGSWDQNSSTLMSTSLTTMSGPCEMPEMPEFELHYDNGSGPVMWEAVWNYEEYEDCTENTYEDGYSDWECDVDYDGDGMVDYTSYYENCEYDNASMMFWCETWEEYPYLESGNYSFTLNVTNLEVGEAYELYANYYLNTQMGYDSESTWISWNNSNESYVINNESLYILVDEYMCSLHLQFEIFTQGNNIGYDEFSFEGGCEEMPSPFELYYDNGSGPVMWEPIWNYEEFDNCTQYTGDGGYWECPVDYDGDGMADEYWYFENCEYQNASMTYLCTSLYDIPHLEPGNYTFTLNVTNLEVGEWYDLHWDTNDDSGSESWNATEEYEHFEWTDIEVDEFMCGLHLMVNLNSDGNHLGQDWFDFKGDCEEMPSPFELYYDNGSGPVMWEPIWNYEEFDNCTQYTYEEGYSEWECGVDYDGDGMADDYWNFENCEYQNASMTYLCTSWGEVPYLESGNYTFTLNVTNLEVGENYTLHWYANFNGMNVYEWDDGNFSWTATDEYEHFELLDIEIDENTCGINIDVGLESDHKYDNDYFNFVGECLQPPNPLSLYYDGMLWEYNQSNMGMYPLLNEGVHDMTWDLTQLENGTEYNLTWEVMSMTMFGDGEDEINNTILFNATNVEMMFDWELIVDNNTCFIMVMGILEMPEVNWPIMNMAMFEGPCEMPPMSDIGLEIDIDGMWYDLDGLPGNDTLGMMMGMEDEYNIAMMVMDMYGQEMDEGNYTLRWTFEDLTIGENYSVLLEDLMNQEPMMLYENCTQWMTDGEDGDYDEGWSCMEDNGNVELDWCDYIGDNEDGYEVYECEIDNPYEDIIYNFTASSETEQLEWELEVNEDDCGFVFLVGLFEGSFDDEDGFPMALSMYALEGPAFVECMGDDNTTNDEIMFFMMMTDADGDYNMSWDEFEAWLTSEDGADEQNLTNEEWGALSALFNESDWNGNSLLDIDEIGMFFEHLNEMRGGPDNQELDIVEYIVEIDWTSGLGYTDGVNFTFFLSAGQMLDEQFRTDADYMLFNGDGELNDSESMEIYYLLMENLDTNPSSPEDLTLNGVAGEIIFVGYDIVDLASGSESNPAIISMWDVFFFDVAANDDGNYEFTYTEDEFDEGQGVPSNFCAISYQYSYEILEFIWNGTTIELTEDNDCIGLNANEAVPSFSVTYGQEVNNDFDNDGVNNEDDAFPYDPSESADTDGDGWGDNEDVFPDDADEWLDTDGDGVGDNGDEDYDGDGTDDEDEDSDGDGVNDANDDFPNDANESTDTDGDGVGDNEDVFPNDVNESSDLDGDGIGDNGDEDADGDGTPNDVDDFPLASSSNDADNDGVENDIDAFPNNPNEYFDTDGDGIGDNADLDDDDDGYADSVDAFPNDASEYLDSDGDGVGDAADQFPNDANERKDSDGDNVGDNSDAFPSNFNEWADSDNDGVGDNTDAFPNDATEIVDSDNDGVGNNGDAFPYNANEQKDSDNNGVGDNAQSEQEGEEPPIVEPEPADGGFLPGFSSAMGIVSMLGAAILVAGRRKD